MTLRLLPPSLDLIAGYAVALETGWSPNTTRDVSGEQLDLLRREPALLIEELTRQDGMFRRETGELVPRLPSRIFWLDDGEFCGSINLRFQHGTDDLPPYVEGHVGYAVVSWKQRCGYATEALRQILPVAREVGLERLRLACSPDNEASRRVILKNGGVFDRRYQAPEGATKLSFWIVL